MMRRRIHILMALLLLASCSHDVGYWDGPVVEFTLDTGGELLTRASGVESQSGVDRYNENLISYVDFFFYPANRTGEDATYHKRVTSGKRRSDVIRLSFTSGEINSLIFPSSENIYTCKVFAVVNYPSVIVADDDDLSGTSLSEIQALTVTTDFVSPENHRQPNFIMSGEVDLLLKGRSQAIAAAATINLERYACKLTVGLDVAESVTVGTEIWKPMLSGMQVYLVDGVSDVTLAGEKTVNPTYFSYRTNPLVFAYVNKQDELIFYFEKDGNYYNTYPTYMYPQHWQYGSDKSPDKEPYLKLILPWVRQAVNGHTQTQKQFYYKIMIPNDRREDYRCSFVRNNWYHYNINVGILGSETDEAKATIQGSCYIYDWQDKNVVVKQATIGDARYLSMDRDSLILRNISDPVSIGYTSSHPVEIQNLRVTRPYYGDKTSETDLGGSVHVAEAGDPLYKVGEKYLEFDPDQQRAKNNGNDWFHDTGTAIVFQHTLNNNYQSADFDYSPYKISFRLRHADNPDDDTFERTMYIEQYPGVYIIAEENSDWTLTYTGRDALGNKDRWNKQFHTSDYWGFVFVDNEQIVRPDAKESGLSDYYMDYWRDQGFDYPTAEDYHWRVVWSTSVNHNMYKVNVTVLPHDSDFVIGDPRTSEVDNLRDGWHTGDAIEGGTRALTWYYPAENSDRTKFMLAPSIIVASKSGGVEFGNLTFNQAKWRCAAFQEDGYPAGRWRLPTQGEIQFIATLAANKTFTAVFSTGSDYWSANGKTKVNDNYTVTNSSPTGTALSRCVYDLWYWGEDDRLEDDRLKDGFDPDDYNPVTAPPTRYHFVWGDRQR